MPSRAFINQGLVSWIWTIYCYFNLWIVLAKLKWGSMQWLQSKVEFRLQNNSLSNLSTADSQVLMARHEAVRIAARLHFLTVVCLPKSIVLAHLLNKHGYAARAVIGVAKSNTGLSSHAWVETLVGDAWCMLGEAGRVTDEFRHM